MLIVGDVLAPEFRPWYDYGYSPDPVQETLCTLNRLDSLAGLSLVLPGHGRPLADVPALLELHRNGIAGRLEAVSRVVGAGARTGYEVSRGVFGEESTEIEAVWRLSETACYLRHHRLAGRIHREDGAGGFRSVLATDVGAAGAAG
jgi:glyoxylase-like metal-dependent hydrolase (beta-lactamase superfamily II)